MILNLLAQASPTTSPAPAGGAGSFIILIPLFAILYFLMIRPQKKARAAQLELTRSVEIGDEVETVAGMYGKIARADDQTLWVELAPGLTVRMSRGAIRRKILPDVPDNA